MRLLLLVYLNTISYDYVENSLGSCWRKDILSVKGLALTTKGNFFVS